MSSREGILCVLGNPLLDIQAKVDREFLTKWGLKENNAILVQDELLPMFDEMVQRYSDDIEYVAGGAAQNTARVAQWIIKTPKSVIYMGSVGKDSYGEILRSKASEVGVIVSYQYHPTQPTGKCAVCLFGHSRSLCAHLAAANHFTVDHLEVPENWKLVTGAKYYYVASFHLTVCPPAVMRIAEHAFNTGKLFTLNLSAPFLCTFFKEQQLAVLPYVDILFGNDDESQTFANENGLGVSSIPEIALKIAALPKRNEARPRTVVITQGANPVIVVENGKVCEFPITPIDKNKIEDTNGAGDAFVGGFLSQLVQGRPLEKCVDAGNWAARIIIQRSGCTYPEKCDYE